MSVESLVFLLLSSVTSQAPVIFSLYSHISLRLSCLIFDFGKINWNLHFVFTPVDRDWRWTTKRMDTKDSTRTCARLWCQPGCSSLSTPAWKCMRRTQVSHFPTLLLTPPLVTSFFSSLTCTFTRFLVVLSTLVLCFLTSSLSSSYSQPSSSPSLPFSSTESKRVRVLSQLITYPTI